MAENRWQIAIGAVVLLIALLIGAFSAGVYIGRYGLTAQGLRLSPSDANQPQNNLPAAADNQPTLIGRLLRRRPEGLDLATQQGRRFVGIDSETQWLDNQGNPLQPDDFQDGAMIAIFGQFDPAGNRLVAARVVRLPEQPPDQAP